MNNPKFKELATNSSQKMIMLLLKAEEKVTQNNKPYLVFEVSDGDSKVTAKKWDTKLDEFPFKEGTLIWAEVNVKEYKGAPDYTFGTVMMAPETAKIEDFITKAPINAENVFSEILMTVDAFTDASLGSLISDILWNNKEKLLYWAAATSYHHNLHGGLLYHMYRMLQTGKKLAEVYTAVNKDVLLAGIIVHDIGKLKEMHTEITGSVEYTVDGTLFGHGILGIMMLEEAYKMNPAVNPEVLAQVKHIIAAHHGKLEWGALTKPATLEAFLVHQIDMIDANVYKFEEITKDMEPGAVSEYVKHMEGYVYKPLDVKYAEGYTNT